MDDIDLKILSQLRANARMSGADIARKIHLSVPAVTERLRKLDRSGVIAQYTIRYQRELLGLKLLAFVKVWLDHSRANSVKAYLTERPEVLECHHVAGEYDLLLKVLVRGTAELEEFLTSQVKNTSGISRTSTTIVLSTYKEELNRPIE